MRLPIFRSGHNGFGDSRRHTTISHPNSYHRSYGGVEMRFPGEIRAGGHRPTISNSVSNVGWTEPPIDAVEWEDSSGNPLILVVGDNLCRILQYGTYSADETLTATATGACLHDDGAGVPYYYVGYGGAAAGSKIQRRNLAATWGAMTNLVADKLLSLGGELYGTRIPASGSAASAVWKIAAGTSITAAISLPTGTAVGFPGSPINDLKGVRRKVVALKPEGVFTYDRDTDLWFNHASWLEAMPHADNGKQSWHDERGDLIIALGTGGALHFDGETCSPYDPLGAFDTLPDENTPTQVIAAGGSLRHWSLMATKIGGRRTRTGGSGQFGTSGPIVGLSTDSGATYGSNLSGNLVDFDPTSTVALDSLATATGYLLVGHPSPFAGVYFEVALPNSTDAELSAEIWTGSAWASIAITDLTVDNDLANPCSLTRSGWVLFDADPVAAGWAQTAITVGTSRTRYFVRFKWDADLDAEVEISAMDWLPWRPGVDAVLTNEWLDRSGGFPHIFAVRHDSTGAKVAHDLGTIGDDSDMDPDEIGCMLYGSVGAGGGSNSPRVPIFFGKVQTYIMNLPDDDRGQMYPWLDSAADGGVELSAIDLTQTELGQPGRLTGIVIDGEDWHATGYVWARFLNGQPWTRIASFDALPIEVPIANDDQGRWLQIMVGWLMSSTIQARLPGVPRITEIDVDVEPAVGPVRRIPRQTPVIV